MRILAHFLWSCLALLWLLPALGNVPPRLYAAGSVRLVQPLPDGSLVIVGRFDSVDGAPRAGFAKLDQNGQLDPTWTGQGAQPNTALQAVALAASPDGSVLYVATANAVQALTTSGVGASVAGFSLLVSGSVDGFNNGLRALAVAPDGKLYLGGAFAFVNGTQRSGVARVGSNGAVDGTWIASVNSTVASMVLDAVGGRVYLGGAFVNVGGSVHLRVARVHTSDGAVDNSWTPAVTSTSDGVHGLALSAAGDRLLMSGNFTAVNGVARSGIARVALADAALDGAWNPPVVGGGINVMLADGAHVYLGTEAFCCVQGTLARVDANASGTLDATWSPRADASVRALVRGAAGSVLAFGDFGWVGDLPMLGAADIGAGALASQRLPDFERPGSVSADCEYTAGAVLLGGDFAKADDQYRPGLLRLAPDASLDASFLPPRFEGGSAQRVGALACDAQQGRIYVGGDFSQAGGQPRAAIARLDAGSGALDGGWAPTIDNGRANALLVAADGVFVGGQFTRVNGITRNNLAKLDPNGALVAQFTGGTNGAVTRLAQDGSGLYVGGQFLTPRTRLARLSLLTGGLDASWNPTFPWVVQWADFMDFERTSQGLVASLWVSVNGLGGVVVVGDLVQIDSTGTATELARFNQPVFDLMFAADGSSLFAAGTFQTAYALDNFFAQTSHPAGLAQVSLAPASFGQRSSWPTMSPPLGGGVPGLIPFGDGRRALLGGTAHAGYPTVRPNLAILDLALDRLLANGFE